MKPRYFGEPGSAGVYYRAEQAPVPVGQDCAACEVAFKDGDRGWLIPTITTPTSIRELPWHRECWLLHMLGAPYLTEVIAAAE